jgi:hypothetical protein
MNPRQFLQVGGAVLLLVGILGFIGVIGPSADDSIFGDDWWFDNGENWAHTLLGIAGIAASFVLPATLHRPLVLLLGVTALFFAVYNIFDENFPGTNLESPLDLLLHLAVGAWAIFAATYRRGVAPAPEVRREPPV